MTTFITEWQRPRPFPKRKPETSWTSDKEFDELLAAQEHVQMDQGQRPWLVWRIIVAEKIMTLS